MVVGLGGQSESARATFGIVTLIGLSSLPFGVAYRGVEAQLAARGLNIFYETVKR